MDTAKDIVRRGLPIKCLEAVFLGLYLTAGATRGYGLEGRRALALMDSYADPREEDDWASVPCVVSTCPAGCLIIWAAVNALRY
jgi:hypothetical protein